jgi:hypothetical protein
MAKEKGQKDKQQYTKHTYSTKYRVTRTPLKTGGELVYSGMVSSYCATNDTSRVNLVTTKFLLFYQTNIVENRDLQKLKSCKKN